MKAALLGDIHANLPALEAVLSHARQLGVDVIWNIGDFVGYGPFPEQVVRRVRDEGILSIAGNYDRKVLRFPKKKDKWRHSKRAEKFLAFGWAYEHLSEESREYLEGLPDEVRLEVEGKRILIVHASPASDEEHLAPDTPSERLRELRQMVQADLVIFGHSHRPFARQVDGTWFINTGSVGRPDDGDPRACYAVLEIKEESIQVQHFRLDYDMQRAAAAIRERGLPEVFAEMILQGVDLEHVD